MTPTCGIRSAAKRLALAVAALGVLGAFWSASALAQTALGASAGSLVGNATQAVGETTDAVTATAQSTVPSATAAESSAFAAPAASAATTVTATAAATTAAAPSNAAGSTLTTATGDVVKPVVDTVAQTVEAASDSLSSTSQRTLDSVSATLAGGARPSTVQRLVTTAGTTAAPLSPPLAGSTTTQPDEQPGGAIDVIAPALDSPVVPAAPGRAVAAPPGWVQVDPGSQTTSPRAPRARVAPSGGASAPILGEPATLTLPPVRQAASAGRGGSLPRIPDLPGGLLASAPATGASGGSTALFAALMAALLLAVPRVGRWLRPAVATRPLPIPQLSLEPPG
jgi:hypothetical protein